MNLKILPTLLPGILCLCIVSSCKKKEKMEQTLPPVTSEGKGTFACLINGNLWLSSNMQGLGSCVYETWQESGPLFYGSLRITRFSFSGPSFISFNLHNRVFTVGKHLLYEDTLEYDRLSILKYNGNDAYYYFNTQKDSNNFIFLNRLDTIQRIVSGIFQFTVIDRLNVMDTLRVTKGRFDLRF